MAESPADRPAAPRIAATFRIRLGYSDIDSFVEGYAANISQGGIFVPSRQPRDKGAEIRFELLLKEGSPAIAGTGRVAWARPFDPARPGERSGMGVRFLALDGSGEEVVRAALAWRAKHLRAEEVDREIADEEPRETPAGPPKPQPKPPAAPGRKPPPKPGGVAGPPGSGSGAAAAATEPKPRTPPPPPQPKPEVAAAATEPQSRTPPPPPQPKPQTPPPPPQPKPELPAEGRSPASAAGTAVPQTFEEALRQRLAEDLPPDDAYDGVWEPTEAVAPDSEQEIIERLTRPPDPAELSTPDLRFAGSERRAPEPGARGRKPGLWSRLFGRKKGAR